MTEENSEIIIYNTDGGKNYNGTYYALPMVLAVGFRVRSIRGNQFRKSEICLLFLFVTLICLLLLNNSGITLF